MVLGYIPKDTHIYIYNPDIPNIIHSETITNNKSIHVIDTLKTI
jgi:hypothetical protein